MKKKPFRVSAKARRERRELIQTVIGFVLIAPFVFLFAYMVGEQLASHR